MNSIHQAFEYHLLQLDALFEKAGKQKNPGLWLYRNNARTPFFMLEGLAKLQAGIGEKKKFSKLKEHFKVVEDALGAVDYYDSFAAEFSKNKTIPKNVITYLQAQAREKVQRLNELLEEKGWTGDEVRRLAKARKLLSKTDWPKESATVSAINAFYGEAIYGIVEFINKSGFHFTNVESDVHELRRKLRWLSIYPQALRGLVQLSESKKTAPHLKKYLVPEIINSSFNKMPDAGALANFLLLDKNEFLALSWMIAELGRLKDKGLRQLAIREALQQNKAISDEEAFKQAFKLAGGKSLDLPGILKAAEKIAKTFFEEKNLEYLVVGEGKTKA